MSFIIRDPNSNEGARVSDAGELATDARTSPRKTFISEHTEKMYSWVSTYSAAAAEETISVQNTSATEELHIEAITVAGIQATVHAAFLVTSGTPAGTVITGVNQNKESSKAAAASAFGDAAVTGTVVGDIFAYLYHPATASYTIELGGSVILGQDDAVAVRHVAGTTGIVYITIQGYYDA